MPALLMHIQGADQVRRDGLVPSTFREAVDASPWAYRLGAFLVDLPLFDRFWLKVALFLVRRPYPESTWGTVIHTRGSASIAAALLRRARGAHQQELQAIVAGLLTHLAFDRSMHPPIEDAVARELRPGETPDQLHEALDNYQCLRWHRNHLGVDGLGTSILRESVMVCPGRAARLPGWLARDFGGSLGEAYGVKPTARELSRWTAGVCGYRDLLSTRAAQLGVRSSERLERHRPWVQEVELEPAYERALKLCATYLEVAAMAIDSPDQSFIDEIGDGPLV